MAPLLLLRNPDGCRCHAYRIHPECADNIELVFPASSPCPRHCTRRARCGHAYSDPTDTVCYSDRGVAECISPAGRARIYRSFSSADHIPAGQPPGERTDSAGRPG